MTALRFLVLAVVLATTMLLPSSAAERALDESTFQLEVGGKAIEIERFTLSAKADAPRLVFLHGSGGMFIGAGQMREGARALARAGFDVYLPHYFDRTGTVFVTSDEAIRPHFAAWLETVDAVVRTVARRETRSPKKVLLFGYSLGAYLALEESALSRDVSAVAAWSGGMHDEPRRDARRFPPALLIHGEKDRRVLPDRSREVAAKMKQLGTPVELVIVPGQGHSFDATQTALVRARVVAFFKKWSR